LAWRGHPCCHDVWFWRGVARQTMQEGSLRVCPAEASERRSLGQGRRSVPALAWVSFWSGRHLSRRERGWFGTVREGQEACPADCTCPLDPLPLARARRQGGRGKLEAQQNTAPTRLQASNNQIILVSARNEPTNHSSQIQCPYTLLVRPASSRSVSSTPKKKNTACSSG
jgi:hypothetical protein